MAKQDYIPDPVKEAKAVAAIREAYGIAAEDEELLADTIEGETNLNEVVDAVLDRMLEADTMVAGLSATIDKLKARKARFEQRNKLDRAALEQAFAIADLPKLIRPTATLSLRMLPPGVLVTDEAEVPSDYWKAGDPVLDKKALGEALNARQALLDALPENPEERAAAAAELPPAIPGATLTNGAPSITIRRA